MPRADSRPSIFITGAASGIGRATAILFGERGWFVGAYDVNAAGLESLAAELGAANCVTGALDVTDRDAYRAALADFAAATDGKLDIHFANAGIGRGGFFEAQPWEDVLAVVAVNLVGVLSGVHLAIPLLKATPGSLCFITSSSSATYGMAGIAVYSATKHAVKGFTEALAVELKASGVRVADVLPGMIDTPIHPPGSIANAAKEGMFRVIPPLDVALAVWEAYHTDKVHWYVPPELHDLDMEATRNPEGVRDRMATGGLFTRQP